MSQIHNVKPDTLSEWLTSGEALLLDVREPVEYNLEHIEQARNLPLSQVTIDEAHLPEHRDKKLVLHCQSGKRSLMACEKLQSASAPFDVWNLEGGIIAWKEAKLPTIVSEKKVLPLGRQVQVAVGVVVLVGTLLGIFSNPAWFVVPVFASLGLINAGLTGWCGLAKVIAKMPWNQV
jgi:rhodanese-related sulfurtransferase